MPRKKEKRAAKEITDRLSLSLSRCAERPAFCIAGAFYSYRMLAEEVDRLRSRIRRGEEGAGNLLPVIAYDNLSTYALLIALWMEGKGYLPLNPEAPEERNNYCKAMAAGKGPEDTAYLLFTSGTTGHPKGVPVLFDNLAAFVNAFEKLPLEIDENSRFLQMFDLTFDMSVFSWLLPLLHGACVYTLPPGQIKYLYASRLMEEHQLTHAFMVPSVISYLRPYFEEIRLPALRTVLFAGEALYAEVAEGWRKCAPRARFFNAYGPSEATVVCTAYGCEASGEALSSHHGIVSLGKELEGTEIILCDESRQPLPPGETGEICIAGAQLFPGYWEDPGRNKECFFAYAGKRFFKSGDLGMRDEEGSLFFLGRSDGQVKIDGFRVELAEVEFHLKQIIPSRGVVVLPLRDEQKNQMLVALVEGDPFDLEGIKRQLKERLPAYMNPARYHFIARFPQNSNGKLDKNAMHSALPSLAGGR